jgi:predicted NBD/HSP70 family sugar kinase
MLSSRLHRGFTGGAGEIGWLPVPGEPLPVDVTAPQSGSFQRLVGLAAVTGLAHEHGVPAAPTAAEIVTAAVTGGHETFLDALALRLAIGVAAVTVVLDPRLVVLSGDVGRAGGTALAARVETAVARICPSRPHVTVTEVQGDPVLRGALTAALTQAREEVFSTTVDT